MAFLRRRLGRWKGDLSMISRMDGRKSERRCDRIILAHSRRGRCGESEECLKPRRVKYLKVYGRTTTSWDRLLGRSRPSPDIDGTGIGVVVLGLILAGRVYYLV